MPTTVASSCAIALPSTVAVSTHRPRAVPRCRPSESAEVTPPGEVPVSVTPPDVPEVAGGLGVALVRRDAGASGGERRGRAVAGEHDGFFRHWHATGGG